MLVPAARLRIQLLNCPYEALQGLQLWSHVWVLYVFHENTGVAPLAGLSCCGASILLRAIMHTDH